MSKQPLFRAHKDDAPKEESFYCIRFTRKSDGHVYESDYVFETQEAQEKYAIPLVTYGGHWDMEKFFGVPAFKSGREAKDFRYIMGYHVLDSDKMNRSRR